MPAKRNRPHGGLLHAILWERAMPAKSNRPHGGLLREIVSPEATVNNARCYRPASIRVPTRIRNTPKNLFTNLGGRR
jgi:hypothetical protein